MQKVKLKDSENNFVSKEKKYLMFYKIMSYFQEKKIKLKYLFLHLCLRKIDS